MRKVHPSVSLLASLVLQVCANHIPDCCDTTSRVLILPP